MQLWLTFAELGELLGCDSIGARDHVYGKAWERRRCSDGMTRALLPPDAARAFLLRLISDQTAAIERGPLEAHAAIGSLSPAPVSGEEPQPCEPGDHEVSALMGAIGRRVSAVHVVSCNG